MKFCLTSIGNIEPQYQFTRHNVGNIILSMFKDKYYPNCNWVPLNFFFKVCHIPRSKPTDKLTLLYYNGGFINEAGKYVSPIWRKQFAQFNKAVLRDDIELPIGRLQIRANGRSARGHNGIKNLQNVYGDSFKQLNVGIGRNGQDESSLANWLLQEIPPNELDILQNVLPILNDYVNDQFR